MTVIQQRLREKLQAGLDPKELEIIDQSALHAGHSGNPKGGPETHFLIRITSNAFEGKTLLEQHKMVYHLVHEELTQTSLHALSLDLKTQKP